MMSRRTRRQKHAARDRARISYERGVHWDIAMLAGIHYTMCGEGRCLAFCSSNPEAGLKLQI